MSVNVVELPSNGLAYTREAVAKELRRIAEDVERGTMDPIRLLLIAEDRETNYISVGGIGDRVERAMGVWMLEKAKQRLMEGEFGLYVRPDEGDAT